MRLATVRNALTVDTEDWFQVFYGSNTIGREVWPAMDSKIGRMVDATLAMLEAAGVRATFFVVGWLAEHHPRLVRSIADHGHEIASHGYWHTEVFRQSPADFAQDVKRAKQALEDALGRKVKGYRAPGYSIRPTEEWALDVIRDAGHRYDSSMLHSPEACAKIRDGLFEVAPNAIRLGSRYLPSGGGFFFRVLPYGFFKRYVDLLNGRGRALVFYTHTWEIDVEYPRMAMPRHKSFVQYTNLRGVRGKLVRLLADFDFASIETVYPSIG